MITAKQFRDEYVGKSIDVDGAAGVQCVDLFKQACYLAGKGAFALGGSGYSDEIVHRFDALGLGSYFNMVSLANAQYGDWIIWDKNSPEAPNSHVAMFIGWQGSKVNVLGQNQFNQKKATEGAISASGIIGVLRLKEWATVEAPKPTPAPSVSDSEVHYEKGTFTLTVNKINFRSAPSVSASNEGYYTVGQSVNYDRWVRSEGYVWISWVSASKGVRRWMACRVVETNEPWGTFK